MNAARRVIPRTALGAGLMALALGIVPSRAAADISIGTVRTAVVANTNTLNITNVAITGANRYLLVAVCYGPEDTKSTDSVVLDPSGAAIDLTHLDNATAVFDNDCQCQLWGLLAPPLGTFTVRVTLTGTPNSGEDLIGGAWPLSGVDQVDPRRTVVTNAADGDPEVTVSSAAGEIVFGAVFMEDGTAMQIQAPGVEDWEINSGHPQHINDAASRSARGRGSECPVGLAGNRLRRWQHRQVRGRRCGDQAGPHDRLLRRHQCRRPEDRAPTVGISSGTATFSEAQPDNVGVGDEVTYGGGTKAYIAGRTSSTVYTLQTATGGVARRTSPTRPVTSITRAFPSLAAADSQSDDAGYLGTADLVANDIQLNWPCYNDPLPDTAKVNIDDLGHRLRSPHPGLHAHASRRGRRLPAPRRDRRHRLPARPERERRRPATTASSSSARSTATSGSRESRSTART